ncbi:MAG: hypothetical protein WAK51_05785, partial [Opitutaceae bacterium]
PWFHAVDSQRISEMFAEAASACITRIPELIEDNPEALIHFCRLVTAETLPAGLRYGLDLRFLRSSLVIFDSANLRFEMKAGELALLPKGMAAAATAVVMREYIETG